MTVVLREGYNEPAAGRRSSVVEQRTRNAQARGSNPLAGSRLSFVPPHRRGHHLSQGPRPRWPPPAGPGCARGRRLVLARPHRFLSGRAPLHVARGSPGPRGSTRREGWTSELPSTTRPGPATTSRWTHRSVRTPATRRTAPRTVAVDSDRQGTALRLPEWRASQAPQPGRGEGSRGEKARGAHESARPLRRLGRLRGRGLAQGGRGSPGA